jgi:hypothetical protein
MAFGWMAPGAQEGSSFGERTDAYYRSPAAHRIVFRVG